MRGDHHAVAARGKIAQLARQALLRAVVETTCGLVQQQQGRLGRENEGECEGQALTLGKVLRMRQVGDTSNEGLEHGAGGSRREPCVTIAVTTLRRHALRAEQGPGVLGDEADEPDRLWRAECGGTAPEDVYRAMLGPAQPHQMIEER